MNQLIFDCRNPSCLCKVGVKSEHYPFCSADCQKACTPHSRFAGFHTPNTSQSVSAKPPIQRKPSKENREQSE